MSNFWSVARTGSNEATVAGAQIKLGELEARCERAMMVCEALFGILRDKLGVTEEELVERLNEIDLSDGQLDRKAKKSSVATCPSCNRVIAKRFPRCIYCSQPIMYDPFQ